jgi:hypothetical protein
VETPQNHRMAWRIVSLWLWLVCFDNPPGACCRVAALARSPTKLSHTEPNSRTATMPPKRKAAAAPAQKETLASLVDSDNDELAPPGNFFFPALSRVAMGGYLGWLREFWSRLGSIALYARLYG